MKTKGTVFNIQRFCTDDGPGIRTTVFLKGCPLCCIWCHNPEGVSPRPSVEYDHALCRGCQACAAACRNNCHSFLHGNEHIFSSASCLACGACADSCRYGALRLLGRDMTAEEVVSEAEKDMIFYAGSGGITLSGGEPLMQPDFSCSVLSLAKIKGMSTCVETSGYADRKALEQAARYTDLFLFDIKETDEELHIKYTSVSLCKILENLALLCTLGKTIRLRCPIIPGLNDRTEHFRALGELRKSLTFPDPDSDSGIQLMPYHPLGIGKARRFGMPEKQVFRTPSCEELEMWNRLIRE